VSQREITNYKAVLFDAADTLLQAPSAVSELQHFLAEHAIHMEQEMIEPVVRQAIDEHYYGKTVDLQATCTPESDRQFWVNVYRSMFRNWGIEEHHHLSWSNRLYDRFTSSAPYTFFDDVLPTIERLQALGIEVGVISNFAPTLREIFIDLGMPIEKLNALIISTEVNVEKPNPAIFQLALTQTGLLADEILYVGDHPINDVEAPNLVGIDAVRIKRYTYQTGEGIAQFDQLFEPTIPCLRKGNRT
jgi:putative hydrolase of the HAD superfamily